MKKGRLSLRSSRFTSNEGNQLLHAVMQSLETPALRENNVSSSLIQDRSRLPQTRCRRRTLKYINSRPVLLAICTLVVIECACVLAELMVDLQGIKFRFENEENELLRFVEYLKGKYPEQFASFEGRTMEDVIYKIRDHIVLRSEQELECSRCPCTCASDQTSGAVGVSKTTSGSENDNKDRQEPPSNPDGSEAADSGAGSGSSQRSTSAPAAQDNRNYYASGSSTPAGSNGSTPPQQFDIRDLFVLEINNVKDSFFLVAEYAPDHVEQNDTKHSHYNKEYRRVHKASTTLHIVSLVILSFMVVEINWSIHRLLLHELQPTLFPGKLIPLEGKELKSRQKYSIKTLASWGRYTPPMNASPWCGWWGVSIEGVVNADSTESNYDGGGKTTLLKLLCMGTGFLKKRFEVFDAFIVISSFALDFVFLDSRWYETGKDATTILVLLLPWRVVRIVNSFLMTIKHKHHIEMMNIKRAKKRADFKNAKLQTLLTEIRKDVQLLVALCRNSHLPEADITSCLYGLGRRSTTLNAVTSCTTIMLVSALGKDASVEDEIYGRLFADALRDPADHDAEPEVKKAEEEAIDAAIELDKQIEQQNKKAARATKPRSGKRRGQVTRSYTVPRRSASIDHNIEAGNPNTDTNGSVFYVNDAFGTHRASGKAGKSGGVASAETLAGLAGGPSKTVASSQDAKKEGEETAEGKDSSWEGRLPPKYQSKASVRSLPAPGSGHNYVLENLITDARDKDHWRKQKASNGLMHRELTPKNFSHSCCHTLHVHHRLFPTVMQSVLSCIKDFVEL
ncbi:hypothetical protein BaRGS_00031186 [Batillaria attramentaria]|uniref:Uncharacterized protein n=1 Tax=Batillaria attramentaria TaxID=370345 RepID=A0ABD0JRS5_9CAEN